MAYIATAADGAADGAQALTLAARTALQKSAGPTVYPLNIVGVNDNTTYKSSLWGIYLESHAMNSVVDETTGAEFEIRNAGVATHHDPYNSFQHHQATDLQLGCGAAMSGVKNCGYAESIYRNTAPFNSGILFQNGALDTTNKAFAEAIQFPANYWIDWYTGSALKNASASPDRRSGAARWR